MLVVTALALLVPPSAPRATTSWAWPVRAPCAGAFAALGVVAVIALVAGLRGGSPLHPVTRQVALFAATSCGALAASCVPAVALVGHARSRATRVAAVALGAGLTLATLPATGAMWVYGRAALAEGPHAGMLALGRWLQAPDDLLLNDLGLAAPAALTVLLVVLRVPLHARVLAVSLAAAWIARALDVYDPQLWIVRPLDDDDLRLAQIMGGGIRTSSPSEEVFAEFALLPLLSVFVPLAHVASARARQTRVTVAPWTGPNEPREERS